MNEETQKEFKCKITQASGERLDRYLVKALSGKVSRAHIQKLIKQGNVLLNKNPAKSNSSLKPGDEINVRFQSFASPEVAPWDISLDIVFEDESLLVVNKPAGMIVHPAGTEHSNTLVNALLFHTRLLSSIGGMEKPGIVHRLDKDTSGLIVIAKTDYAHTKLSKQFKEREVFREYIAFVKGIVNQDEGIIEAPLARSRINRKKICVNFSSSRQALTNYEVIERFKELTVLRIVPKTGRTHQIRVHLAYIGHPILGDIRYGGSALIKRQALHAKTIGFKHPLSGGYVEFTSHLPQDMELFLENIRLKKK